LKFFAVCQTDILLKHFAYTVLDALVVEVFPELGPQLQKRT
jgi:hypothetical protein